MTQEENTMEISKEQAWKWYRKGFEASGEGYNGELVNDLETAGVPKRFSQVWEDEQ